MVPILSRIFGKLKGGRVRTCHLCGTSFEKFCRPCAKENKQRSRELERYRRYLQEHAEEYEAWLEEAIRRQIEIIRSVRKWQKPMSEHH